MRLDSSTTVCIDTAGSDYDTAIYARTSCNDQDSEVVCNDDADAVIDEDNEFVSMMELDVEAGRLYFIFVDGCCSEEDFGDYTLTVTEGPCPVDE